MRIALYSRVSTEEQRVGRTIESQISELEKYSIENKYEIIGKYLDDGWTGSIIERPELDRLRDDAKQKKFDAILIHHPDRLSRVQLHQLLLLNEFEKDDIKVIFYKLPEYNDQSEESRVVNKSVWSMVSELERLRIRERTRRGRRSKAEKGHVVGHKAPYGYLYKKQDKNLNKVGYYQINHDEAQVVKKIYRWAIEGMTVRGIVRQLAEEKILSRYESNKENTPKWVWRSSTVHKILRNSTYFGVTYFNKYESCEAVKPINNEKYKKIAKTSRRLRPKEDWIAIQLPENLKIISKKDFDLVQEKLKQNSNLSPRNSKYPYLLKGLIHCSDCGEKYYGEISHGKANYRCSNRNKMFPLPKRCASSQVSVQIVDVLAWTAIKEILKDPKLILKNANRFVAEEKNINKTQDLDKSFNKLENEKQRLIDAYKEGVIEISELKAQIQDIKNKVDQIEETKEKKEKYVPKNILDKGVNWLCKEVSKVINNLSFDEKIGITRNLITSILLDGKNMEINFEIPIIDKFEPNFSIVSTTSWYCEHNSTISFKVKKKIPKIGNQNSKAYKKFQSKYEQLFL
jgi:site-specific DNA recombinase